jgi:glycerophosphoryl diester phosphodiesterase
VALSTQAGDAPAGPKQTGPGALRYCDAVPARVTYLDAPGPLAFAHRGGALEAPENTMRAFTHAVGLGYQYLETDVQLTRDGVLVAFHDRTLDRVTDRSGVVGKLPWSEVRNARVAGSEPIPVFADLLEAFPEQRFNIDAKDDRTVEPLVRTLRAARALDRVCLASFNERTLRRLRAEAGPGVCSAGGPLDAGPSVCSAGGPLDVARVRAASAFPARVHRAVAQVRAACLQVPETYDRVRVVDRRFVRASERLGLPIHVWTVNEAAAMDRLLDLGVLGIMTDRPTVLKEVLQRRGQWMGTDGSA